MKNAQIILLIMNCHKYKYKSNIQRETWLQKLPSYITYYHVLGKSPTIDFNTEYKIDENNHILYVNVDDDYNSLPKKVIASFAAIQNEYTFSYIFKTDDDQHIENIFFFEILEKILFNTSATKKIHYGGYMINVNTPYISSYCDIHPELPKDLIIQPTNYCSGRFYILSDLAIMDVLSKRRKIESEFLEDYAIGFYLNSILKTNILHLQTNKYFQDIETNL